MGPACWYRWGCTRSTRAHRRADAAIVDLERVTGYPVSMVYSHAARRRPVATVVRGPWSVVRRVSVPASSQSTTLPATRCHSKSGTAAPQRTIIFRASDRIALLSSTIFANPNAGTRTNQHPPTQLTITRYCMIDLLDWYLRREGRCSAAEKTQLPPTPVTRRVRQAHAPKDTAPPPGRPELRSHRGRAQVWQSSRLLPGFL